ncbi:MAG: hypothetical protein R2795_11625 [Saprospiraceae bacterium]
MASRTQGYAIGGAAWSFFITVFVFNALKLHIIYRKLAMLPFSFAMIKTIVVGAIGTALVMVLPPIENPYLSIILREVFYTTIFLVLAYFWKISEEGNQYIQQFLDKLKH